jgi:predicted transcriptional regulator
MHEPIDGVIKKKIHALIAKNPGLYTSKIALILNLKFTDVQQHIEDLHKQGLVVISSDEGYDRYYSKESSSSINDASKMASRQMIYNLISEHPGLYRAKIAEILGMSTQLAEYHLTQMQRNNQLIAVKKLGQHHQRYYISENSISGSEMKILEPLAKNINLSIVLLLLNHRTMQHKELSLKLKISPSRLSYHLNELVKNDIITINPFGQEKGYELRDKKEIYRLIKKYKLHLIINSDIEDFVDLWQNLKYDT